METQSEPEVSNSVQHKTSFFKTCFNALNSLAGIGILSMPYALSEGGWLSLILLIIFATTCCYTSILLDRCMKIQPLTRSYPDIVEAAFGYGVRTVVAIFMYLELFLIAVELLIIEGDNLDKLFPNMKFNHVGLRIGGKKCFVLLASILMLATAWLKSLKVLAYVSFGGILASIILIGCVIWVGVVDGVGFHERGELVNWHGFSTAMSLFAFCYCAHAVMPTICNSMSNRSQFSKVLMICFGASTIIYGSIAVLGYTMFGKGVESQITLNLPAKKISTKIAIFTTVINPFTKYAVVMTPILHAVEEKWSLCNRKPMALFVKTTVLVSTVLVALFMPFFGYIMAFIGAFLSGTMSLLIPCLCYLRMNENARRFGFELVIILVILIVGTIFVGIFGTYVSVRDIVKHL